MSSFQDTNRNASCQILGKSSLIDVPANRRYLLGLTQHRIGGFGKFPEDLPGMFNSQNASHGQPRQPFRYLVTGFCPRLSHALLTMVPDILHSYMALASLSIMGEPGLKPIDPLLCMSRAAKARLQSTKPWKNKSANADEHS